MKTVNYIEIVITKYHEDIVGRIRYCVDNDMQVYESNLYSLSEINNILTLWRDGALCGSFAMGTRLAQNPVQYLKQKEYFGVMNEHPLYSNN